MTLLELMIAVAIIGVLGAIAVPYYKDYQAKAKYIATVESLQRIDSEIRNFFMLWKRYPNDLTEIGLANLKDPWGNNYEYLDATTTHGRAANRKYRNNNPVNTDFDLYSKGPDGASKQVLSNKVSLDDIIRAGNGNFFGWAKEYI